jgi:simple sugar transport system permease protein
MPESRPISTFFSIAVAVSAAFLLLLGLLPFISETPGATLQSFFTGPFRSAYYLGNFLNRTGLYALAGLAMLVSFQGGMFNLGGEGQVYAGALATTMTLILCPTLPGIPGIIVGLFAGILGGTVLAGISGFFRMKWNTDELISSFLLSSSVVYTIDYLVSGPLRDREGYLLSTPEIAEHFHLPPVMSPSHLNIGIFMILLLIWASHRFLYHSSTGYELRITGLNREFAAYGGIPVTRYYFLPITLSGALYGLTGSLYILGTGYATIQGSTAGMGWNGIAVALIARNRPSLILPAALVFTFLESGAQNAVVHSDFSFEFGAVLQGVVLFLVTARVFKPDIFKRRKAAGQANEGEEQ